MHDGAEVILDRWHLKAGHDKFAFMEQSVTDPTVKKVIVICDKAYAEKADERKGGVGTETQIISPAVYKEVSQEKFIPIVREWKVDGTPCLPTFMATRMYFNFSINEAFEESYDQLIRNLHDAPELKPPGVGKPPSHIFSTTSSSIATSGKLLRLRDAIDKGKSNREAMLRDYLVGFTNALGEFNHYNRTLDEYRMNRLKLNRYSVVADLIRTGATGDKIHFRQLFEMDMLIFIRQAILKPTSSPSWYPRLTAYAESRSQTPLDIFARATTSKGTPAIRDLLGITNLNDLLNKLDGMLHNQQINKFFQSERFMFGAGLVKMVNWEELVRNASTP